MAYTSLSTIAYKNPGTVVWANSVKANDDFFVTGAAKAFVNFDGSAAALSARNAFNIASITDIGAGNYRISLTTPLTGSGHIAYGIADATGAGGSMVCLDGSAASAFTTTSVTFRVVTDGGAQNDSFRVVLIVGGQY